MVDLTKQEALQMQDYAKLYKCRYTERRSQSIVNKIRRILKSGVNPLSKLVLIAIIVHVTYRK